VSNDAKTVGGWMFTAARGISSASDLKGVLKNSPQKSIVILDSTLFLIL
jgi:hypothetical protein